MIAGARSVAAVAAVGNLLQGWDSSAIAGALLYIKPEFHLQENPTLEGLVVAATLIAAVISTIFAGPSADRLGRRKMLCVSAFLLSLSGCMMLWSPNVYVLLLGRFLSGSGIGLAATIVPVLIAESAPAEIRGQLSTIPQLAGTGGQFISYCLVFALSLTSSPNWRLMLGILSIPSSCYLLLCILFLPESPRWLVSKGYMLAAKAVLQKIRNKDDVTAELALLVEGLGVGAEAFEEYLLKPADVDHPVIDGKLDIGENIKLYGPEEGLSWIATPLPDETGLHAILSKSATADPHIINPLIDPMVTLLDSIQTNIDNHLERQPEATENANLNEKWDEENQTLSNGDEDLRRPLLSIHPRTDTIGVPKHHRGSILSMDIPHSHASLQHESFAGSMADIGGGWQLAWKWTGTDPGEEAGPPAVGSLKRVFFLQENNEPSNAGSAVNLPSVGVPAEEDAAVQAAALIGQPALYAVKDVYKGESVGPAMLHPAEIASQSKLLQLSNVLEGGVQRALVVGMGIQFLQQVCGINAVLYYTPQILQQSGVDILLSRAASMSPESCSILASATTCFLMLPCIVAAMRLIDISGRRTMLLATLPLLAISLIAVAVTNAVLPTGLIQAGISFLGLSVFTCTFVAGFGPIPNILCSEIFPTRVRGMCISLCSATMWVSNVIITDTFPILFAAIGIHGVFALFAAMSVLSWLFVFLKVPETKGLPLEVISELFALAGSQDSKKRRL